MNKKPSTNTTTIIIIIIIDYDAKHIEIIFYS